MTSSSKNIFWKLFAPLKNTILIIAEFKLQVFGLVWAHITI
jgi:hypothetical protein